MSNIYKRESFYTIELMLRQDDFYSKFVVVGKTVAALPNGTIFGTLELKGEVIPIKLVLTEPEPFILGAANE